MSGVSSITERMASTLVAHDAGDFPPDVVAKAELCLVDFLSGAFEAAPLEWSRQAAAIATPLTNGAAMIAGRQRAVPEDAAFANAVAAHGLVREDMHTDSIAHLGVVIWPALLAMLSRMEKPVGGTEFLAAGIAGYEVGGRVGSTLMTAELARLFRPTGMVGAFSAAAACGLLLGLDDRQLAVALGLAANTAAGFNEWPHSGGSEMYFHAGFAARNGMAAALLAREGAFAAPTILEGEAGLFRSIGRCEPPVNIPLFSSETFDILTVFHKQAPACNYAQTPCQAALRAAQHFAGSLNDIATIAVRCTHAARQYPGCDHPGPFGNILQAKMSIQYGVAATIASGAMSEANYARIGDPEIEALIGKITLETDDVLTAAYPARQGSEVTIATRDGQQFIGRLADVVKADAVEVGTRFIRSAAEWLGARQAQRLRNTITGIAARDDVRSLNALCLPAAQPIINRRKS